MTKTSPVSDLPHFEAPHIAICPLNHRSARSCGSASTLTTTMESISKISSMLETGVNSTSTLVCPSTNRASQLETSPSMPPSPQAPCANLYDPYPLRS